MICHPKSVAINHAESGCPETFPDLCNMWLILFRIWFLIQEAPIDGALASRLSDGRFFAGFEQRSICWGSTASKS